MRGEADIPPPDAYLDAVFGERGIFAAAWPGYRPREGQRALAEGVDRAIWGQHVLVAEAGCGTGKSISYSVPATYWASRRDLQVVIATANIALQEQLVTKDLPLLQSLLPWDFTFSLFKGRNNYLCLESLKADRTLRLAGKGTREHVDAKHLEVVRAWADACAEDPATETGDVSELPFEPESFLWRSFSRDSATCKKQRCAEKKRCFANQAFHRAQKAHVVVTNHHLLAAHLAIYLRQDVDAILPPFHVCIVDEAHKLPDIVRDSLGESVTARSIARLEKRLDPTRASELHRTAAHFFQAMKDLRRDKVRYKTKLFPLGPRDPELPVWLAFEKALEEAVRALVRVRGEQRKIVETLEGYPSDRLEAAADELDAAILAADRSAKALDHLRSALNPTVIEEGSPLPSHVYFLDEDEVRGTIAITSKWVRPGAILHEGLFTKLRKPKTAEEDEVPEPVAVIATSATLATSGQSFAYALEELGAQTPGTETLICESPFRWSEQCLFVCPDTMPAPNAKEFADAVAEHLERIVILAEGRTLGLFTSRKSLDRTHDRLRSVCAAHGYTLLKQGDAPRTKLVAQFREDVSSVLLGTESFWAGVDVPGEACSVVVMDRLPFAPPDDPVLGVLQESDPDWFWKFGIPRAIIPFRQGAGRLVRSDACYGAVVCLDRRILDKSYGKTFLKALPPDVPKTTRLDAIAGWLAKRKGRAA